MANNKIRKLLGGLLRKMASFIDPPDIKTAVPKIIKLKSACTCLSETVSRLPGPNLPTSESKDCEWEGKRVYYTGEKVIYKDKTYLCRQTHTALTGWEPPNALALWKPEQDSPK